MLKKSDIRIKEEKKFLQNIDLEKVIQIFKEEIENLNSVNGAEAKKKS